jgi:hypothetical protein
VFLRATRGIIGGEKGESQGMVIRKEGNTEANLDRTEEGR